MLTHAVEEEAVRPRYEIVLATDMAVDLNFPDRDATSTSEYIGIVGTFSFSLRASNLPLHFGRDIVCFSRVK